jgi:ATP-dependent protease ClpP protease subunit
VYARAGLTPEPVAFAANTKGETLTLDMMDVIGPDWFGEGITARAIQSVLTPETKTIRLRINSPGGDATEGTAIRSILRTHAEEHGATITAEIHGMAASAATVIAMAADEIVMAEDALFMIHEAWSMSVGDADGLRAQAAVLDKINGSMAALYATRSGQSLEDTREMMAAETWFTAEEAIEAGFADRSMKAKTAAKASARVFARITQFSNPPPELLARYGTEGGARLAVALIDQKDAPTVNEQTLKLLGLRADAGEDQIIEAVASTVLRAEQAEALAKDVRAEVTTVTAERDALAAANVTASVAHRIETLKTQGKCTPAEADALAEKFAARCGRGQLAIDLFLEDLTELEAKNPLALAQSSGLDARTAPGPVDPNVVTPAQRAMYGADVPDEQILKAEQAQAKADRDAKGNS